MEFVPPLIVDMESILSIKEGTSVDRNDSGDLLVRIERDMVNAVWAVDEAITMAYAV
jgi:hypothetical protein